jgi:transposase
VEGGRSALAAIERGGDGNLNALLIRLVGLTFMFDTAVAGHILLADWAYDSNTLREGLAARGAWVNILAMPNCLEVPAFSHHPYKQRNAVERFFNKLTLFRAVATRYDKWDDDSLASVKHSSLRIWHRFNEPVT